MLKLLLIEYRDKLQKNKLLYIRFAGVLIIGLILLFGMLANLDITKLSTEGFVDKVRCFDKSIVYTIILLFFITKILITKNTNICIYVPTFIHFYSHRCYRFELALIFGIVNYLIGRGFIYYSLYKFFTYLVGNSIYYFISNMILLLFVLTDVLAELTKLISSFTLYSPHSFVVKVLLLLIYTISIYTLKEKTVFTLTILVILLFPIILKSLDIQKFLNYNKIIYKSNWGLVRGDWGLLFEVAEEYKKLMDFNEKKSCDLFLPFPLNIFLNQILLLKRVYSKQIILLFILIVLSVIILDRLQLEVQLYCYFIIHAFVVFQLLLLYLTETKKHIHFYLQKLNSLQLILSAGIFVFFNVFLNLLLVIFLQPLWYFKVVWYLTLDTLMFLVIRFFWQSEKIRHLVFGFVTLLQWLIIKL